VHELGLIRGVLTTVLDAVRRAPGQRRRRVTRVAIEVRGGGHLTESMARQHFAAAARGTPAEGAELRIRWLPLHFRCVYCLARFESAELPDEVLCPRCAGAALADERAETVRVRSIQVEET